MCVFPSVAYAHVNKEGYIDEKLSFRESYYYNFKLDLPCRHCILCQARRRAELATLMKMESLFYSNSCFITLTYNNKNLPVFGGLNYLDISTFFESLRKHFRRLGNNDFQYVYSGEYGLKSLRPHFHAVLFGLDLSDIQYGITSMTKSGYVSSKLVDNIWHKGFNSVLPCTDASCAYTVGYTMKKLVVKDSLYLDKVTKDTKERNLISADLGYSPLLQDDKYFLFRGRKYQDVMFPSSRVFKDEKGDYKFVERIQSSMSIGRKFYDSYTDSFFKGYISARVGEAPIPIPKKFMELLKRDYFDVYKRLKVQNLNKMTSQDVTLRKMTNDAKIARICGFMTSSRSLDLDQVDPLDYETQSYFDNLAS